MFYHFQCHVWRKLIPNFGDESSDELLKSFRIKERCYDVGVLELVAKYQFLDSSLWII